MSKTGTFGTAGRLAPTPLWVLTVYKADLFFFYIVFTPSCRLAHHFRMIPRFARLWLAASLVAAASLHAQVPTQPPPHIPVKGSDEMVESFKLSEGDLDSVLGALETYTGRIVLRPQALPISTYTITINRPIPKSELVLALETLLALNQVGVSPLGDKFLKIVPLAQVKSEAPQYIEGSTLGMPPSGRIATKLFQLNFLRANEFFNGQLNGIFSPGIGNGVVVLDKANAALITDSISNLQRIETLINSLDKPSTAGLTVKFYPLHNAKASDLVTKLHSILTGPAQSQIGSATTFNADDRTNQVVLLSDAREQAFFDGLIAQLDIPSNPNTRNEVIYLKHADAKDVATLLAQLVSGQNSAAQKSSAQSVRPGEVNLPGQPAGLRPPGESNALANAAAAAIQALGPSNEFSSLVTIVPDERSNSVVVSGTPGDISLIQQLIDKIDIVLAQVRIECIIAEVTLQDQDVSGIQALNLTVGKAPNGGTSITNFSGSDMTGWSVTSGVVNPLAFVAAFGSSASTGQKNVTKVLSAPVIVTTHNKAAEIQVGESLPILTGTSVEPLAGGTSSVPNEVQNSTVSYQNIVIDLKVTPLIGDDGNVQMTIDQKVQDIVGNEIINGVSQPIIGIREATSFISCQDGQMVVLGGLQRTEKDTSQTKLGFIYEIPILSQLLGGHTDNLQRTELLFFIRPHVIPLSESTDDTKKNIKALSNKKEIQTYLQDPGQQTKDNNNKVQNFLDRFK
jgi:general secretion pathway protein D